MDETMPGHKTDLKLGEDFKECTTGTCVLITKNWNGKSNDEAIGSQISDYLINLYIQPGFV